MGRAVHFTVKEVTAQLSLIGIVTKTRTWQMIIMSR